MTASSTVLAKNNAGTTLAGAITNVALTANLAPGSGTEFPSPGAGQYFVGTFTDSLTGLVTEIVYVTNVTGDVITMIRAQEGTVAAAWNAGDLFENLMTAGQFSTLAQQVQVQQQAGNYAVDSGAADALVVTLNPVPTATTAAGLAGYPIRVKIAHANLTTTPTITVNGLGPMTIVNPNSSALAIGQLQANMVAEFVPDGTNAQLQTITSSPGSTTTSSQTGGISGFLASSIAGTSTTGSLTVSTGFAADSTNATVISKNSTTAWAVSNGNIINGFDGGTTLPNSSTIHFFICSGASGTGVFASTSLTPTFPTGYATYSRRIFSLNTSVAGALLGGTMREVEGGAAEFYLTTQILDVNDATLGATRKSYATTVPTGIRVRWVGRVSVLKSGVEVQVLLTSLDETDVAPNAASGVYSAAPGWDFDQQSSQTDGVAQGAKSLTTNTSAQWAARSTAAATTIAAVTAGNIDFRRI